MRRWWVAKVAQQGRRPPPCPAALLHRQKTDAHGEIRQIKGNSLINNAFAQLIVAMRHQPINPVSIGGLGLLDRGSMLFVGAAVQNLAHNWLKAIAVGAFMVSIIAAWLNQRHGFKGCQQIMGLFAEPFGFIVFPHGGGVQWHDDWVGDHGQLEQVCLHGGAQCFQR